MKTSLAPPFLVLALLTMPAAAALVGSVSGIVNDPSGRTLAGVSVTLRGPSLQGARTAVTRSDGRYDLFRLPPGPGYRVQFS